MNISNIPLYSIREETNVRQQYDNIDELADSIEQIGLINPITVRQDGNGYVVITGHRRLRAYRVLAYRHNNRKFTEIPAIISKDGNHLVKQIAENIQRDDLTQYELYLSLKALREAGLKQDEIARVIGKKLGYVKHLFSVVNEIDRSAAIYIDLLKEGVTLSAIRDVMAVTDDVNERVELLKKRMTGQVTQKQLRKAKDDELDEIIHHINTIKDNKLLMKLIEQLLKRLTKEQRAKVMKLLQDT